jgi:hypothetical protein
MLDLAMGTETKNYGLKRGPNPQVVWGCIRMLAPAVAVACAFSFHLWVRAQIVQIGYQTHRLDAQIEGLLDEQRQLVVLEQIWKDRALQQALSGRDPYLIILPVYSTTPGQVEQSHTGRPGNSKIGGLTHNPDPPKPTLMN